MQRRWARTAAAVALTAGLLVVPKVNVLAAAAQQWVLVPPAGTAVTATVRLDAAGRLSLEVSRGATQVLKPSALGIRTSGADLSTGLTFTGRADSHVTGSYATASGRRSQHTVDANETTLHLAKGKTTVDLVVRVSGDGVGYRYVLPQTGAYTVTGEASEYAVPATARAILLPYDNGRNDYESIPAHTTVAAAAPVAYGYPSLFNVGDSWLLATESAVNGSYGASRLTLDATSRTFKVTLPDARTTGIGPLSTPWRTLVVGDLATVAESDLVTDLAGPTTVTDTSWIRAGRSTWSWWSNGSTTRSLVDQKRYVDFAARMGWEYNLVDAGWGASWIPELVSYARTRNVGIFIWVHYSNLGTAAERDAKLPLWHSWGVVGLKIDFIQSDSQATMKWYDAVLAATARNKLMIDFHGATIPRGTERTWPQVMTSEAVRGAEMIHDKPGREPFPANYYTTLPFARNLAGSMDYTPVTFTAKRTNTDAAELAQSVVFESGLQNFADSIESYDAHPLAERFLKQVSAGWDETKLLAGDPDGTAMFARRRGANWFIGAITAGAARTVAVPLSFLGAGTWSADIYADAANRSIALSTRQVTSADTLQVPVLTNGGFVVALTP
jgi:alpha-glucosidase